MRAQTVWALSLVAAFVVGILGAFMTGDVRYLALCVVPGAVFARWWRV